MDHGYYILIGQTPVPCDDLEEWARFMRGDHRRVRLSQVGEWFVSTVFLGLDHNHFGEGPPLLFETMAWKQVSPYCREWKDDICERCATWEEAERQHIEVIVQLAQPDDEIRQIEPEPLPENLNCIFEKERL